MKVFIFEIGATTSGAVGQSKTDAGEGRTIPLNSALYEALKAYADRYVLRFGEIRPEWYVFPFGRPRPYDPNRPVTTLKTAWRNLRKKAKVSGRWHDNRHTLITELAESGASDQTIMDIAGHVSKQMLKHYSHIRMEAKRKALESIVQQQAEAAVPAKSEHRILSGTRGLLLQAAAYAFCIRGSTFQTRFDPGSASGPATLVVPAVLPRRSWSIRFIALTFGNGCGLLIDNSSLSGSKLTCTSATTEFLSQPNFDRQSARLNHCFCSPVKNPWKSLGSDAYTLPSASFFSVRNTIPDLPNIAKMLLLILFSDAKPLPARSGRTIANMPELSHLPIRFCAMTILSLALMKIPEPAHPR